MKYFPVAGTIALFALVSVNTARAADMPVKAPPTPAPAYSWTGFYVGGNAGYGFSSDPTVSFVGNDTNATGATCGGAFGGTCPPNALFGINGALGGLQGGYNWQLNRDWLLSVEADFDWSRIRGSGTSTFNFAGAPSSNFTADADVTSFGTARVRVGYLPINDLLLFGTAGFAYGHLNENVALNASTPLGATTKGGFGFFCGGTGGPNCFIGSSSATALGWTAGAGLEYSLWKNISVKAEYLFVGLKGASVNVITVPAATVGGFLPSSFTASYGTVGFSVVRVGLNYKF
jgi:outer membrane immunogenic protein